MFIHTNMTLDLIRLRTIVLETAITSLSPFCVLASYLQAEGQTFLT